MGGDEGGVKGGMEEGEEREFFFFRIGNTGEERGDGDGKVEMEWGKEWMVMEWGMGGVGKGEKRDFFFFFFGRNL